MKPYAIAPRLTACLFFGTLMLMLNFPNQLKAQLPGPATLSAGLNAVTGSKGVIDTEVLADVILEKQIEVKRELIKKGVSKTLQGKSYAFWEYGYLTIEALVEGNNQKIITQKLLEQAANLYMVYEFANFGLSIKEVRDNLSLVDCGGECKSLNANSPKVPCKHVYNDSTKFYELPLKVRRAYLDVIYDVLINNTEVTRKHGFFKNRLPFGVRTYNQLSKYKTANANNSVRLNKVHQIVKDYLSSYMEHYYIIDKVLYTVDKQKPKNKIKITDWTKDVVNTKDVSVEKLADQLKVSTDYLSIDLPKKIKAFTDSVQGILVPKNKIEISGLTSLAQPPKSLGQISEVLTEIDGFAERVENDPERVFEEDLYYIEKKVRPMVGNLVVMANLDPQFLEDLKQTEKHIKAILVNKVEKSEEARIVDIINYNALQEKNNLPTDALWKLDNAHSYEVILDELRTMSSVDSTLFGENGQLSSVGLLLSILKQIDLNMLTDADLLTLEIDVEEVIIWMYDKFIEKVTSRRFTPYFTIGLNYSNIKSTAPSDNEERQNNFSYASEKIGFQLKLWDIKRQRIEQEIKPKKQPYTEFKFYNQDPVVSNVHWIGYVSGVLYTLVDASTNQEFDSPLAATGIGLTFFNSLELNFSHVWPLDVSQSASHARFFQVSFDVKITDYIMASRKKRLALKKQKQLLK